MVKISSLFIAGILLVGVPYLRGSTVASDRVQKPAKQAAVTGGAWLDHAAFKARGKNETLLHIDKPGRYSLQVKSGQGTRIELVDRMSGVIGAEGTAGQADGRLDIVLDKGEYKVRLLSHPEGSGQAALSLYPFVEGAPVADPADHPLLRDQELVSTALGDHQQRSYWVELKKRQVLNMEVQGRALAECRLWRDGVLWEEVRPTVTVFEPIPGQPMTHIEFHHDLGAGLYLLRCYGGEPRKWAEEKSEYPLYLRLGIPYFGENGQRFITLSPFGRDAFLMANGTDFFQLVRAEKKPTELTVHPWTPSASRYSEGRTASIDKESRDPWCSLGSYGTGDGKTLQLVAVRSKPGDALELDYFKQQVYYTIRNTSAQYWISSIHSAEGRDALDVTAILFNYRQKTAVQEQLPVIRGGTPFVRRVNLLGEDNIYLSVEANGVYSILEDKSSTASADYQFNPFMIFRPENYREPEFQPAGKEWTLVAGYYVLTIRPKSEGILHFLVQPTRDLLTSSLKSLAAIFGISEKEAPASANRGFFWPSVRFFADTDYELYINSRSRVQSGIILRKLPLDPEDPLPVPLNPGQSAQVAVRLHRACRIQVLGQDGQVLQNGSPLPADATLPPDTDHLLVVKNGGQAANLFNLVAIPVLSPPAKPVVKRLEEVLPTIVEGKPIFANYDRGQTRQFLLRVKEPAFYRLETTGLLATGMKVRSLMVPAPFAANENGIGRNALVQQYLKPGDYIVSVQARGQTRGRAGLQLRRTPMIAADDLSSESVSRRRVPADTAVRMRFRIPQAGMYRLQTLRQRTPGQEENFVSRLEEEGGWPLIVSTNQPYIEREFEPGSHTLYSLPEPVESRRVTRLSTIRKPTPIRGKGPHRLVINQLMENIWMETDPRQPDLYTIEVTAPIAATLTIEKDLEAVLRDGSGAELGRSRDGEWKGELKTGTLRLEILSIEKANRLPYTLTLSTPDFIPGMERWIEELPTTLEISLGEAGLVEISSFGSQDCRATLREKDSGASVATADDTAADWNFSISRELKAGRYLLDIESMTPDSIPFQVRLQKRLSRTSGERTLPFTLDEKIGKEILKVPIVTPPQEELLHFRLAKGSSARLSLVGERETIAEGEREIIIPLPAKQRYTLMIWQEGDQAGQVKLAAQAIPAAPLAVDMDGQVDSFRAARVHNASGFGVKAQAPGQAILYSPSLEQPCRPMGEEGEEAIVSAGWLVLPTPGRLHLAPFVLKPGEERILKLGAAPLPLAIAASADPLLLECESTDPLIGLRLQRQGREEEKSFSWGGLYMEKTLILAGIPEGTEVRGEVRSLRPDTPSLVSFERVTLRLRALPLQPFEDSSGDDLQVELKEGHTLRLPVKARQEVFRLLLPQGTAAFNWSDGKPAAMEAATSDPLEASLLAHHGALYLMNLGDETAPVRASRDTGASPSDFTLDFQKGFERVFDGEGNLRLAVDPLPPGQRLCVAGENIHPFLLTSDGRMDPGQALPALGPITGFSQGSGLLVVEHGSGFVRAWLSPEDKLEDTFMGPTASAPAGTWQGDRGVLINGLQKWPVDVKDFCMVVASITSPGVMAMFRQEEPTFIWGSSQPQNRWFQLLERGHYTLYTRPLSGSYREGFLTLQRVPVQTLALPGPKQDLIIGPNECQVFRITVKVKGTVGVGIRCDRDLLDTVLFGSAKGPTLGAGPLIIRELDAGDYFLVVAAFSQTVRFRPIVLGAEGSLQGIPEEVLRDYLKGEDSNVR